ncbi:MAG: MazG-like family protein [Firmicutes bacterium]|jgi:NTP pyrophosphatase (non-canonical NTP hydrolase)|nr:MazG-like family protein [Bacillota bacterium]
MADLPVKTKTIALPRPNNLRPTLESTALKLMEEAGELAAAIIRFRGLDQPKRDLDHQSAHVLLRELLDVAQTAVTMMFVLEEHYDVDVERALGEHVDKLIRKGYLVI